MSYPTRRRLRVLPLALVLVCSTSAIVRSETPAKKPHDTGIVEETGRRLGQLDVTVSGPPEVIADLTAADFELIVGRRFIESFILDRACNSPAPVEITETLAPPTDSSRRMQPVVAAPPPPAAPAAPRPTYLFYFDQHHLTASGRQNSLDTARTIVDRLMRDGARAMIVSAGKTIQTIQEFTEDRDRMQDALDRLEHDSDQWDIFPYQEESRIEELINILHQDLDLNRALGVARRYQREEQYRTDKALRLFGITIGRMADLDAPKAVLYFADTMRKNAGEHYASYFPRQQPGDRDGRLLTVMESDGFVANNAFDRVVKSAASNSVRLYTVQGEGMLAPSGITSLRARSESQGSPLANKQRRFDAQHALVGMARETGGRAFLHGAPGKKIARAIKDDLSCLYLISFDVAGFPEDRSLAVNLRTARPKVVIHVRGQIVLASAAVRKTTKILAAFTGILPDGDNLQLEGIVIPTGFEEGRYQALVQIRAPALPMSKTTWEIGASLVSRGRVREDISGRIEVDRPSVPVIFEAEVSFGPGPFELVMVAHEQTTDQIARTTVEGDWPDPDSAEVTLSPLTLIQPSEGAFLRGGELRRSGSLGVGAANVKPGLPAAVIGLVCRGKSRETRKSELVVERKLVGDSEAAFTDLMLSSNKIRCIQLRDIIRAGTMTEGRFTYELRVVDKGKNEMSAATLEFTAVGASRLGDDGT